MEQVVSDSKLKGIVETFLEDGILLSPDIITSISTTSAFEEPLFLNIFQKQTSILVLNKQIMEDLMKGSLKAINWQEFDTSLFIQEKRKDPLFSSLLFPNAQKAEEPASLIKKDSPATPIPREEETLQFTNLYREVSSRLDVQNFIGSLNLRFKTLSSILLGRKELQNVFSISRLLTKKDREQVSLIGMIRNKELTSKNKHLKFTIEDSTGTISVLVNKNNLDLFNTAKDTVLDEVVGINGTTGDKIVFANNILTPGVPFYRELKKSKVETYGIVLSDLHVGSTNFLDKELEKGIGWIKGEVGNEAQRELARKIKFIFLLGDLVDGVGVYPDQNKELVIKDIYDQYKTCAEYLKEIPKHIKLIIIPGNHDAVRIEEPQPPLYDDIAEPIYKLPNVIMLSNPASLNLLSSPGFSGFDILLYHGYSFLYYADNVESIRQKGGVDRADLIMQFLLERRHLAPSHTSTIYNPDPNRDPLLIEKIPDFFLTGHLHKTIVSNYKNTTLISGSCWQSKTSFMEKMGIHPEPARVPIINFGTREVKIMRFGK